MSGGAASIARRCTVVLALACATLVLLASAALAVPLPTEPPTEPPVPVPVPTEDPAPEPEPEPEPQPQPDPDPQPDPSPQPTQPTQPEQQEPAPEPSPAPSGGLPVPVPGSSGEFIVPQGPTPAGPGGVPSFGVDAPQVAPPSGGAAGGPASADSFLLVTTPDALPGAIGGVFVLALMTVLGGVGSGFTTFSLTNRGALVARTLTGEIDMDRTRRVRTMLGVVLLGIAGLIGIVGYLRISIETLVPVQIVYLASAGFGVVIFGIAGGSLLVAETLRSDEGRVRELEAAVTTLARHMAGDVQDPPRLLDRTPAATGAPAGDVPVTAPVDGAIDDPDTTADGPMAADDESTTRVRSVRRVVRRDDT